MVMIAAALLALAPPPAFLAQGPTLREREEEAYPVTTARIDPSVALEVGGLAFLPGSRRDGERLLVATRRGEVYAVDGFAGDIPTTTPRVALVAEGLHEPLGLLAEPDGSVLAACRGELARLVDGDGDSVFEGVEVVSDGWSISGNYHEYNFGPARAPDGTLWITTNKPFGDQPFGRVDWRGYVLRIDPGDGTVTPMCSGLRSPAGVAAAPWGEVFYTDNQGEWCGASKLSLARPGSYHGHPHGISSTNLPAWSWPRPEALPEGTTYAALGASWEDPAFQMPSVWFPYDKMGRSPAGFVWDRTGGSFGPFTGQLFVADQYEAAVFRVDLERVRGHWQGACVRFRQGLACGAVRVAFTARGAMIVGETDRGWGSKGPLGQGLQRIDWSGRTPFEVETLRLLPGGDGFRATFTHAVDEDSLAAAAEELEVSSYTYLATSRYGSPEVDREVHAVQGLTLSEDRRSAELRVAGLREGYVHEVHFGGLRSAKDGLGVLHPDVFYTLVRLP